MKLRALPVAIMLLLLAVFCQSSDAEKIYLKGSNKIISGRIALMTPRTVEITDRTDNRVSVSVGDILMISFERESSSITKAKKMAVRDNEYEEALKLFNEVKPSQLAIDTIKQDVEYYKAFCQAKSAIIGRGEVDTGINSMTKFLAANKASYHYFEAYEILGDLQFLNGDMDAAIKAYDELKKSKIAVLILRASNLKGNALMVQNNFSKALASFQEVTKNANPAKAAEKNELLNATVGTAKCMAASNQGADAIISLNKVIKDTTAENTYVHAKAYNALGYCLQKTGKNREALLAYLHVDVLYSKEADEHAQALAEISRLWAVLNENGKSSKAISRLREFYPNSRWARQE